MTGRAVYGPVNVSAGEPPLFEKEPRTAPATMSGAVSPRARESARTVPVRIPGEAAGINSLRTTCQCDAPIPKPASRIVLGTARSASLVVMITIGRTTTIRVSEPEIRLRPLPTPRAARAATNTLRPRSPKTTDGTPARFRMLRISRRVNRLSGAYSSR